MTISEFIAKWRKVELKERSAAQEHFIDLCNVFEHPTPAAADPTGENFCFEKGAAKHAGGDGFADVWKRGSFGFEYKGKHKDLAAAYVRQNVKPKRDESRTTITEWWSHERPRPAMRQAFSPFNRYLATCMVAKHRLFVWLPTVVVPANVAIVFARADDLFFGLLHSRFHEVWSLAQGTQLREKESGFRYTPSTCFETFPFPPGTIEAADPLPPAHAAIAAAAKELNALRETWLNPPEWTREEITEFPGTVGGPWDRFIDPATASERGAFKVGTVRYPRLVARDPACAARLKDRTLTKLYNVRPAWLAACHAKLDAAVAAAYGWPADLTDDAILENLLALNQAAAP